VHAAHIIHSKIGFENFSPRDDSQGTAKPSEKISHVCKCGKKKVIN
jgi:hypothetical protein